MSQNEKPTDLVLSYLVDDNGVYTAKRGGAQESDIDRLNKALKEGYRVIDVLSTSVPSGGDRVGAAAVTVVLTLEGYSPRYRGSAT